jgi:2-polyprenyl-6-methoxyphenol hydroxylase-like FAD-dependent oxidoreductase
MAQQILVIGAGISGLATAVALQRRGHPVTVIEERTDTSSGAGISIWPNALAALDEIGLGHAIREAGGRVTAGALRWRDGRWLRHPARERLVKTLGEPLVVIRRSVLTKVLAGALADGTVHRGLSARRLVTTADGVRVTLSDSTTRAASAVIGADGTRSVVARHLNGALADRYVGYTAWRGWPSPPSTPMSPVRCWAPGSSSVMYRSDRIARIGSRPSEHRQDTAHRRAN